MFDNYDTTDEELKITAVATVLPFHVDRARYAYAIYQGVVAAETAALPTDAVGVGRSTPLMRGALERLCDVTTWALDESRRTT